MAANAMANRVNRRDSIRSNPPNVLYDNVEAPTAEEIAEELKKSVYGTIAEKKTHLVMLHEKRTSVEDKLRTAGGGSDGLVESFRKAMPASLKDLKSSSKCGALAVAKCMLGLEFLKVLVDNDKQTRSAKKDPVNMAIKSIVSTVNQARSAAQQAKQQDEQSKLVTLNAQERDRRFLQDGYVPQDEANRFCAICSHSAVDEPNTNKAVLQLNLNTHETVGGGSRGIRGLSMREQTVRQKKRQRNHSQTCQAKGTTNVPAMSLSSVLMYVHDR